MFRGYGTAYRATYTLYEILCLSFCVKLPPISYFSLPLLKHGGTSSEGIAKRTRGGFKTIAATGSVVLEDDGNYNVIQMFTD